MSKTIKIKGKLYDATEIEDHVTPVPRDPSPTRSPNRAADERFYHFKDVDTEFENGRVVKHLTGFTRIGPDGKRYAAYAECDERDQFDKRRGRVTARRKWFQGKRTELPESAELTPYEIALEAWKAS